MPVRLAVLWLVSMVAVSNARTIEGVLGDAQERVHLRPAPAFTHFAEHLATLVTAPTLTSPSNAALSGGMAIDSTMSMLGPIFLDHADTLGAGTTNVNVISQRSFADVNLFGQPFNQLGSIFPVLARRTPTGDPNSPAFLGLRLTYNLDLHVWATAIAISHGVTDDLDLSVVLPVISTRLNCAVTAHVVAATGPQGGTFTPVHGAPTIGGTIPAVNSTGIGDITVRAKYRLPVPRPWRVALSLEGEFPTGNPFELHGTGAYWITPGFTVSRLLWNGRAELDAHADLHFNISRGLQSQALYGAAGSVVLWPKRVAGIVEFLGTSQLDNAFAPHDTDVLVLTPSGVAPDPLLGIGWSNRLDQFNLSFGIRARVWKNVMLFANGVYALNSDVGVRPVGVIPTFGLGGTF